MRRHALAWLVAANLVGVLLAALLLWPDLGARLGPLTYGRWVALHLDWQLYGWCALPLVGALLRFFDSGRGIPGARLALGAWSLALAAGGADWLAGRTSGKLFLDWTGAGRLLFLAALAVLWTVLVFATAHGARQRRFRGLPLAARVLLLAILAAVPPLLAWTSTRAVYPAVNPHSGGATGASLLGSSLGIIALFGLLPRLLQLAPRPGARASERLYWTAFAAAVVVWLGLDHGNASHHAVGQIAGLATLAIWIPLLVRHARAWHWRPASLPWLKAGGVWWALLAAQGFFLFLPGISERLKFTNALVSHAHLAMAGLLTAVNLLVLHESDRSTRPESRGAFWSWQVGTGLHVAALFALGWFERADPNLLFDGSAAVRAVYGARLAAGLAMSFASLAWLRAAWRPGSPAYR